MRLSRVLPLVFAAIVVVAARAPSPVAAQARAVAPAVEGNFDARIAHNAGFRAPTAAIERAAPLAFAASGAVARITVDDATGVVRTVSMPGGYLTAANAGADPVRLSLAYITAQATSLGLEAADLSDYETTDVTVDRATGATHVYLRQRLLGLPLYNGQLQINVNRNGRILSVNNAFHPGLAAAVNTSVPAIGASGAVDALARHLGIAGAAALARAPAAEARRSTRVDAPAVSAVPITAQLMWLTIRRGDVRLVWNFQVTTPDSQHVYDVTVDAVSGEVWTRFDWVASDVYAVYSRPTESPQHTAPLPPADGRVDVTAPADAIASPYGWHDTNGVPGPEYTIMRGNNVHAYDDSARHDAPPAVEPDCGPSLICRFALNLNLPPSAYTAAAIANLFYWNNIVHDVQYQYGFTEAAGNFQVNNYGRGGLGGDDVQAEAQDGGGTNNANFSTPPDGSQPRMQMYLWTPGSIPVDGDLDSGIIVHEYGHGISNRLVGGPSNSSCLANPQQPGEGLSDWWALVYTARASDTAAMGRGMGTYVYGDPPNGLGIRTQQYSTNPTINTWTYESINGMAVPHGVGSVWAEAAWRMYWALVNQYGFSTDLYNAGGNAGNQRAMLYVNAGLMNTTCSPTFVDVRDGILQAALDNHGGEDVCRIWSAFAGMGLGTNALSGGPNSTAPLNGFAVPLECGGSPVAPVFGAQPSDTHVHQGATAQFSVAGGVAGNPVPSLHWEYSGDDGASWAAITDGAPYSGALTSTLTITAVPEILQDARYRLRAGNVAGETVTNTARLILANSQYDPVFRTPVCALAAPACWSGSLLIGRDTMNGGPEPNQPNTIGSSCADHQVGAYGTDESIDKLSISTTDGSLLRPGKSVRIGITVRSYSPSGDRLDLFHTTNTAAPAWSYLARLVPAGPGLQQMTYAFTLPAGSGPLQAIRAKFSWVGDTSPCELPAPGKFFTDYDDLIFNTTSQFADDPVVPGVTPVKKAHLDELRARINWLRSANGLTMRVFTDRIITAQFTPPKTAHIAELRAALADVYTAMGRTLPIYTDPTLGPNSTIKAVHINELRAAILAIER